jgi:hypothetical protein
MRLVQPNLLKALFDEAAVNKVMISILFMMLAFNMSGHSN